MPFPIYLSNETNYYNNIYFLQINLPWAILS